MDYQLKGKLCFVTAGANGIGAAIADTLTAEGASVIVADQDAVALDSKRRAWRTPSPLNKFQTSSGSVR